MEFLGGPDHDHAVAFADLEPAQLRRHAVLDDWDFETRDRRIGGNGILAGQPNERQERHRRGRNGFHGMHPGRNKQAAFDAGHTA